LLRYDILIYITKGIRENLTRSNNVKLQVSKSVIT